MKKLNYRVGAGLAFIFMLASFTLTKTVSAEINTINKEEGTGECGKCSCRYFYPNDPRDKYKCRCGHDYSNHSDGVRY